MVIDFITLNRKCKQCEKNPSVFHPDCRLNYHGSSKGMEAEAAVRLVINNDMLQNANVEIGIFIADNDSSSIAAVQKKSSHLIIKQSDLTHTKKGVGNILYEVKSKQACDPDLELEHDSIKYFKKCFAYAVTQNVGHLENMQAALRNIPYHAFGDHKNCGSWCQANKENYVCTEFKNPVLFEEIKAVFSKLAENACKFLMAASTQNNESLNNMMSSKAPKRICYSKSESCDFRFAATVASKNYGAAYVSQIFELRGLKCTSRLTDYILASNEENEKRRKLQADIKFKKRRLEINNDRSQLRYQKEKKDGQSYSSNMSLFDQEMPLLTDDNVFEPDVLIEQDEINEGEVNTSNSLECDDIKIIFFDLETGGLNMLKHEILQVAVKCGQDSFNSYVTPTRAIAPNATQTNGLTKINKKLYKNGKEVLTLPKKTVLQNLLIFLAKFAKKCILVAHKCEFDSRRLVLALQESDLLEEFSNIILGFVDSLPLFRRKIKGVENYKLIHLAESKLNKNNFNFSEAHDAIFDTIILEALAKEYLNVEDIKNIDWPVQDIIQYLQIFKRKKVNKATFLPLKGIISNAMINRLSETNFSYQDLLDTYKTSEVNAISLLQGKINGKAQIIKNKQILNKILSHLKSSNISLNMQIRC